MRWKAALLIPLAAALATWAATPAFAATGWVLQTTPNPAGILTELNGISCTAATFCIAVGDSEPNVNTLAAVIERWNGSTWALQTAASPAGAALLGVSCTSTTNCEAVGEDNAGALAERWNGSTWTAQTIGGTEMSAVSCTSATNCEAVGTNIEVWNGTSWAAQTVTSPTGAGFTSVSCTAASSCTAVGTMFNSATDEFSGVASHWNGSTWTAQTFAQPGADTEPFGVSCASATSCMAVGYFISGSGTFTLAELWNGSTWTTVTVPNPGSAALNGVSCISATDCTAVGIADNASGVGITVAEAWNGTTWTLQSTPNPSGAKNSDLQGVSCPTTTDCSAAGFWRVSNPSDHSLAEQWTG